LFLHEIRNVLEGPDANEIRDVINELARDYETLGRALRIKEIAGVSDCN